MHQTSQIDRFLVHGKSYRALRDALGKALIEGQTDGVAQALKVRPLVLNDLVLSLLTSKGRVSVCEAFSN